MLLVLGIVCMWVLTEVDSDLSLVRLGLKIPTVMLLCVLASTLEMCTLTGRANVQVMLGKCLSITCNRLVS